MIRSPSRLCAVVLCVGFVIATACSQAPTPPTPTAAFLVDGRTVSGTTRSFGAVTIHFSLRMRPSTVAPQVSGSPVPGTRIQWNPDDTAVTVDPGIDPYGTGVLTVPASAQATNGKRLGGVATLKIAPLPLEPTDPSSGITSMIPRTPVAVVIDNAPPTRPQTGFEHADIVFEYISEYQITRFTALFFGSAPRVVGPIRSCRMINLYLVWSFRADQMCSGVSTGTMKWLEGRHGNPATPVKFEDTTHFFRDHSRVPPYNLYTTGAMMAALRRQTKALPPMYLLDPTHADAIYGPIAAPPVIPKQFVSYTYDPRSRTYARSQNGRPFVADGRQIHVKNVVLMNVSSHDAGWVEDTNGHAHSVWYDFIGSGPVTIWSDGHAIKGTWHIGAPGLNPLRYWLNDEVPWFTDSAGNVIRLNSGVTWIHVVGTWP
jgi:hypothetical protein